jgi:Holliday junction resolvasome RuvABC endonuclease subunit
MFYVGIDTSTTNTAVVVLDNEKQLKKFKLFSPKSKDILHRSASIVVDVRDYLSDIPTADCVIGLEGASFQSRGMRDKLSMLLGGVFYHLWAAGYSVKLLPPSTIKKNFTGNGRAQKEDMRRLMPRDVLVKFDAEYKKVDDLVDAYAIASML